MKAITRGYFKVLLQFLPYSNCRLPLKSSNIILRHKAVKGRPSIYENVQVRLGYGHEKYIAVFKFNNHLFIHIGYKFTSFLIYRVANTQFGG